MRQSVSSFQGEATHDWEFVIREKAKNDMRPFVEKFVVTLHETFKNPERGLIASTFE